MMENLSLVRRFFAEELQVLCNLRPRLVDAFAAVHREDFLRAGPWTIRSEADLFAGPRQTLDAHPRRVYHNVPVAIDPARQLYNGQPGTIGLWMEALGIDEGSRVLHVGCGLGYFTAVMADCVGASGRVLGIEVDDGLASEARANLAKWPWVELRHGDATESLGETFDAILINAGVTHPQVAWLDALAQNGHMVLPLTCSMEAMGTIGKGVVFVLSNADDGSSLRARLLTTVAIYSAVGIRDAAINQRLGKALTAGVWQKVTRLRRDVHEETAACWLHADQFCLGSS